MPDDYVNLNAFLRLISTFLLCFFLCPAAEGNYVLNGGFESTPFTSGWNAAGVVSESGLNGSSTSARLGWNTTATLGQNITALADFTFDVYVEVAGNSTDDSFHILLDTTAGNAVEIRGGLGNVVQINRGGSYESLTAISDGSTFTFPGDTTAGDDAVRFRIVGRDFGSADANYDLAWSDAGSTTLVHAAVSLRSFANATAAAAGGISAVRFDRAGTSGHSYWVDDIELTATVEAVPTADYEYIPPLADKVVRISGVYPHLAMSNNSNECGPGATVPWAGSLWVVTYAPHLPTGSDDKLYQIHTDFSRTIRSESIGGTPANRFIHAASGQLNIGPYFIDTNAHVRTLSYGVAPGRYTATAAHLTDPTNRLYIFTMEDGVYDVNVNDLSVITRYPDVQGKGDRFLFGYHGKGAYSGQGRLVVGNNGRPNFQNDPTGAAGTLASWDGTTVAENGGSYFVGNDPNTEPEENSVNPVSAQSNYIAGWTQHFKVQHCEVTGPGGIYGNAIPETDPIWATGFDAKSVVLRVMEGGSTWSSWRLPKASYSHDGSHGWHTEWPRIRQLDPSNPDSTYLMHMHGLFYDFPSTFSSNNFSGLVPICNYYKMPVDYCMFNGELVIAKNDTSKQGNALAKRSQSNLWFGRLDDLRSWGPPAGHGGVWMNESVTNNQISDPFLVNGFVYGTLHLRNNDDFPITINLETSPGTPTWSPLKTVVVPAYGYVPVLVNNVPAEWIRLTVSGNSTDMAAFFHMANPYPHASIGSIGTDRFDALADIRDTTGYSDGIIRTMGDATLTLEYAIGTNGYYRIGGPMVLSKLDDSSSEASLRSEAALSKDFGFDEASAWYESGGVRFRLPKLDDGYELPFASGWARGLREVVTERDLLNCHGTFYEVPLDNSGGVRKMRPLATHGKKITDFASWRGLFVLTGVLDDAPESDDLVKSADGSAALWLGEIDDLWQMGEPRGIGGPWRNSAVTAGIASDPYLMYGYNAKALELSHSSDLPVTFAVEVDFLADNTWSVYTNLTVDAGQTVHYQFPSGFNAHWVRLVSDTTTTATGQFTYGPATLRDELVDWARENALSTAEGRQGLEGLNNDDDPWDAVYEFFYGMDPYVAETSPLSVNSSGVLFLARDLPFEQHIALDVQGTTNLITGTWVSRLDLEAAGVNQSGVAEGYVRRSINFDTAEDAYFLKLTPGIVDP